MSFAMDIQFNVAQRQDLSIFFVEPASPGALYELEGLEGTMSIEPLRSVPVRLRLGPRSRQTAIMGVLNGADLNRVINSQLHPVTLPPDGLVLTTKMAEILNAKEGEHLEMEVLEGSRPHREVIVAAIAQQFVGAAAYMEIESLHRLMREGDTLSGAYLQVDETQLDKIYSRLKAIPAVAGVALKRAALRSFKDTIEQNLGIMIFFNQIFSNVIALGVIYNAARISLSERGWELASLRVIGFTKGEISRILLGEFAVLTGLAIPLGLLIGYLLAWLTVATVGDTELYRIPLVVSDATFGAAAVTVLVAAVVSAFIVRRRLNRLDLIAVLKTRE